MKQKYDHYAVHLRKLERAQEAAGGPGAQRPAGTVSEVGAAPMPQPRMNAGPDSIGNRMPRSVVDEDDEDGADAGFNPEGENRAMELFEAAEPSLPQKAAAKRRLAQPKAKDVEDDDDWGDDGLDDV